MLVGVRGSRSRMTQLHNKEIFKERRKILRNNATAQEVILWSRLKKNQLGYKFRRQQSIGPYIVDFYCPDKQLIIELDGWQHGEEEKKMYDEIRTQYLENFGFRVLRFWNGEINGNLEGVIVKIEACLREEIPFVKERTTP